MNSALQTAAEILSRADHVACLTGAGVSAESGIATFRDARTGLWTKFDPTRLASQEGFAENPGSVWRWYMSRLQNVEDAKPNPGHVALAQLEGMLPHFRLITQNVDNLHERAGSESVYHVHGSIAHFRCNQCHRGYELGAKERTVQSPPLCPSCGGLVRPAVVWFDENLPGDVTDLAWGAAENCDVMLVVGTSGEVYPIAHLPFTAREHGATVIDVNPEPSAISARADVYLQGPSGEILPQLVERIRPLLNEG